MGEFWIKGSGFPGTEKVSENLTYARTAAEMNE